MMKTKPPINFLTLPVMLILCISVLTTQSCKREKEPPVEPPKQTDYTFSGTIKSVSGEPITDATILINGKEAKPEKDGSFKIEADSSDRFVVTIKKRGFGVVSKVFHRPVKDYNYQLQPAFTATINPTQANTIFGTTTGLPCAGSGLQNIKFDAEYKKIPFVYDANGRLVDFGWPANLKAIYDYATAAPACNPGATISIPANAIVNASGQPVTTPVTISIATRDLQSRDGMPGDYTYQDGQERGVMTSLGAVSIEVYSGNEDYNLDPKTSVKLSLPVEPAMLKFNKKLPETIPLLYYDEKQGVWIQEKEQMGRLNPRTKAYEAELNHFSSINMDYKMPNPTCFRLRQVPMGTASLVNQFNIGILSPTFGFKFSTTSGNEADDCFNNGSTNLHLIYNAPPPGEQLCVIMTEQVTPPNIPTAFYGIVIQDTPANPYGGSLNMTCPCTSATSSGPCYDGAAGGCDATLPGCDPFSPNCGNITMQIFASDIILAARVLNPAGKTVRLKWIFKNLPVGTPYNYTIAYEDVAAGTFTDHVTNSANYNTIDGVDVTVPTSAPRVRITINTINGAAPGAGTWTSNEPGI